MSENISPKVWPVFLVHDGMRRPIVTLEPFIKYLMLGSFGKTSIRLHVKLWHVYGHLLLYTLSHIEPSGNAPVRPGYNELTLHRAIAACHVQCPNSNSLMKRCIKSLQVYGVI
jgi:hypothetical protein